MGFELRDYQKEAIEVIKETKQGERCLIKIATGGGKTVIFASLTSETDGRVLVVVPSKELREQAYNKIKAIDNTIDVGNVQANLDEVDSKIVVASRQSLTHKKSNRMKRMLEHGNFEYVIIDECHQAVDQIKTIVDRINDNARIIGFTATPYNREMFKVFEKINFNKNIVDMIDEGFLCEPRAILVESNTNLSNVKIVAGEFNQKELEDVVNNVQRNRLIVESYKKYASNRKSTLVFATGINHCQSITDEFNRVGITCKNIDSTMSSEDREQIINDFKDGKIPVLVNVAVLTTGFDHPETDCIMLVRPTKSRILYEQILGRGLRTAEGKEDCLVIDINDVVKNHDLMSISTIFDMKIKSGETPKQAKERNEFEEEQERLKQEALRKKQEELERQRQEEIEIKAKKVMLFNKKMNDVFVNARYDWFRVDNMTYALSYKSGNHFVIELELTDVYTFYCYAVGTDKDDRYIVSKGNFPRLGEAIKHVEEELIKWENSYVVKDSEWKLQRPTENQLKYISWARNKWDCHKFFSANGIKNVLKSK